MSRKVMPARVLKRTYTNGTALYGWRPQPGAKELTGKGPGGASNLELFRAHVLLCWNAGVEPTLPGTFLAPASPTAVPEVPAPKSTAPTLRDWIGDPANGVRGRFFLYAEQMSGDGAKSYESLFRLHGAFDLIGDMPMDVVKVDDALSVCNRVLRCPSCAKRASELGPPQEISGFDLRVDQPTFDKKICARHYPATLQQRTSVEKYFSKLSAAFNAAVRAEIIAKNPFAHVNYGQWEEPKTNDDLRDALSHRQMDVLTRAHPDALQVVPAVSVALMLRRSEMWGLWRSDFPVPPEDPNEDPVALPILLSRVWRKSDKGFSSQGKTDKSLGVPIVMGADAVKALNNHLRNHMAPSPQCDACRKGERIWRGDLKRNPHTACGFASDAPLILYSLCTPEHYSKKVCPTSQTAAGLTDIGFKITHRAYRATGAVQYLEAGVVPTTVLKQGRWKSLETLLKHYNRPNEEQCTEAAGLRDRMRAAELGLDQTDQAPATGRMRFLTDQFDALSARCIELELENAQLRAGEGLPEHNAPDPIVQVPISFEQVGKWVGFSDDDLRSAIGSERSQMRILARLGLSSANKNYTRLRAEAMRLNIELPALWAARKAVAN